MRNPASITAAAVAMGAFAFAQPALADQTITVANDSFSPASGVTIAAGESITWQFNEKSHNVDVFKGPETFRSAEQPSGGTVTKAFTKAGAYEFICDFHGDMTGKFTVTAPAGGGGGGTAQPGTTAPSGGGGTAQPGAAGGTAQPTTAGSGAASLGAALPGAVDLAPPTVRNRGFRANNLNLNLSESGKLVVYYVRATAAGHKVHKRTLKAKKGANRLNLKRWMAAGRYRFSILAFDNGGNMGTPLRLKLNVRR